MNTNLLIPLLIAVGTALVLMWLMVKFSGWDALCRSYPVREPYDEDWLNFQTLKFGYLFHFSSCVSIGLTSRFLYLKLLGFPFAKAMQIPWRQVASLDERPIGEYDILSIVLKSGETLSFLYTDALRETIEEEIPKLGLTRLL